MQMFRNMRNSIKIEWNSKNILSVSFMFESTRVLIEAIVEVLILVSIAWSTPPATQFAEFLIPNFRYQNL